MHANSYNLHDLSVGPLTATPRKNDGALNYFRVPGTSTVQRHFALIQFHGSEEQRQLTLRIVGIDGEELWNRTLQAESLQAAPQAGTASRFGPAVTGRPAAG